MTSPPPPGGARVWELLPTRRSAKSGRATPERRSTRASQQARARIGQSGPVVGGLHQREHPCCLWIVAEAWSKRAQHPPETGRQKRRASRLARTGIGHSIRPHRRGHACEPSSQPTSTSRSAPAALLTRGIFHSTRGYREEATEAWLRHGRQENNKTKSGYSRPERPSTGTAHIPSTGYLSGENLRGGTGRPGNLANPRPKPF